MPFKERFIFDNTRQARFDQISRIVNIEVVHQKINHVLFVL